MAGISKAQIIAYLDEHKFKHSNAGFPFIVDILAEMAVGKVDRLNISKAYAIVAKRRETTKENVEKCVRLAIKRSSCYLKTNKEFLCQAYDTLIMEEEEIIPTEAKQKEND